MVVINLAYTYLSTAPPRTGWDTRNGIQLKQSNIGGNNYINKVLSDKQRWRWRWRRSRGRKERGEGREVLFDKGHGMYLCGPSHIIIIITTTRAETQIEATKSKRITCLQVSTDPTDGALRVDAAGDQVWGHGHRMGITLFAAAADGDDDY